jgi:hypothetical protein
VILARLAAFLAAEAAVLLAARRLLRPFRTGDAALDLVQLLLLRLALISTVVLAAGLGGALSVLPLGALAVGALVAGLAAGWHRDLRFARPPGFGPWALAVGAAVAVRLALQVWFFSPHLGDAVSYHLPKVAEWVRPGGFGRELGLHPHATFPAGFELVETWWVVFLRHDALIEMAGVEFLVLAAAAAFALARQAGLGDRAAAGAALLYALTPGLHLSATSCLNDAPAAALVVALAALVHGRAAWGLVALAGGLAVGIKPTAGFAFPGLALLAWAVRKERPAVAPGRAWTAAAAHLGLVVGGFWYARNLLWFGNPFHPLGDPSVDNPVAVQLGPRLASFGANVRDLLDLRMLDAAAAAGANVDHGAGWGPVAVALGLPGLVIAVLEDGRFRRLAAAFGVSLASTLLFVQNDAWCLKYAFYFPCVLVLAAVRLADRARGAAPLLALAGALAFAMTTLPYDLPRSSLRVLAAQGVATRSALPLWSREVPEEAVGAAGGFRVRPYLLYRPDFSRRVVYLRERSGEDLERRLREEGLRSVYGEPSLFPGLKAAGPSLFRRE